jgi:hypothetical protein
MNRQALESMLLTSTDGGRNLDGYTHEDNDCSVRALAVFADLPYGTAHHILRNAGRQDREGIDPLSMSAVAHHFGEHHFPPVPMMLIEFLATHRTGRYMVMLPNHIVTVIDGKMHDRGLCSDPAAPVLVYWTPRQTP